MVIGYKNQTITRIPLAVAKDTSFDDLRFSHVFSR
jgi:hypothetical protein